MSPGKRAYLSISYSRLHNSFEQMKESSNTNSSDYASDSNNTNLPPPRRSLVSRLGPRHLLSTRKLIILKWFICVLVIIVLLHLITYDRLGQKSTNNLAILLWNEDVHLTDWNYRQCQCVITANREYALGDIDAIVINADRHYSLLGLDNIRRTPNYLMILAAKSPFSYIQKPPFIYHDESTFNFTMTYRLDSDLIWTDYYFAHANKSSERLNRFAAPIVNFKKELSEKSASQLRYNLKLKRHLMVYITYVTNDYSEAQHLYLDDLRSHIQFDLIQTYNAPYDCIPYRFMLIFEFTACPDYVHPHMYVAMANFVVPVLIGGGNLSQLIPAGSYINGSEYSTPQALADHLIELSNQPKAYEQFFWWHAKYRLHMVSQPYCALCHQLWRQRQQRSTERFAEWWNQYACPNNSKNLKFLAKSLNIYRPDD